MMLGIEIMFIGIAIVAIIILGLALNQGWRFPALFIAVGTIVGLLSYLKFYQNTEALPPRFIFLIIPSIIIVIYSLKKIDVSKVNLFFLLMIHLLRIPIEIILFQLYELGLIPKLMTYAGWNWDILSGIAAIPILALFVINKLNKKILFLWNLSALILLAIIVFSAIFSAPSVIQLLAFDQPNIAVLQFPFVWLPSVVVPIVLLSHILIFKYIKQENKINLEDSYIIFR
ncbi:MAG: hypothetical protein RLO81_05075 [Fulvivirga sp.]|uniref:hypothetical protein n=1 Tax=Fulvivirga sp. TaxID=1931237 RepID=UPI0032EFA2B5